jgi:hypothetical protein
MITPRNLIPPPTLSFLAEDFTGSVSLQPAASFPLAALAKDDIEPDDDLEDEEDDIEDEEEEEDEDEDEYEEDEDDEEEDDGVIIEDDEEEDDELDEDHEDEEDDEEEEDEDFHAVRKHAL